MAVLRRDFSQLIFLENFVPMTCNLRLQFRPINPEAETEFLLELAAQNPEIAGVVGWVDFRSPELRDRLQYFSGFSKLRVFATLCIGARRLFSFAR